MNVWRFPWGNFPSVFLHAAESLVKKHPRYAAAKSGDSIAALDLILDTISLEQVERLRDFLMGKKAVLVSAHAYETTGVNAIPEILADERVACSAWRPMPALSRPMSFITQDRTASGVWPDSRRSKGR